MPNQNFDQDRLLDHNYDGIQEFDNPLPRWWVWIFWATIIFAVVYYFDPTAMIRGPGRIKEYEQQMAAADRRWPRGNLAADAGILAALSRDPKALAEGKALFTTTCSPCHRPDGGGLIGPNLTDEYWLHGGTLPEIHKTITEGVLDKGMPNWGRFLKPAQINALAVYVFSLRGSNPPNPKAPQGVKVDLPK